MLSFLAQNLATILIGAAILAIVVLISLNLIKKKKNAKDAGCGCGCGGCPSASVCHKE